MSLRSRILSAFSRRPAKLEPSDWTFVKFYFSQHGEDAVFMTFWDWKQRRNGYYVDVGAYHPIDLSNTHILYRHGWRGLTIDPNPGMAPLFARHRPEGMHLTCAVGAKAGDAFYYAFNEPKFHTLNSMDADLMQKLSADHGPFKKMAVPTRPLAAILAEHGPADGGIDLLSIDCEGMDAEVLQSNDWTRFRPAFIMVEDGAAGESSGTALLLKAQDYELVAWVRVTKIYRRKEMV